MSKELVSDELWEIIEALLPKVSRGKCSPKRWAADQVRPAGDACATGRRRACGRSCTACCWTVSERPVRSTGRGRLWTQRVCRLKGGQRTGANPTDKGKKGSKRHDVSDQGGIPLAVVLSAANVHDSKVLEEAVDAISPIKRPRGRPGRPRKRPKNLHADKGYDFPRCLKALRKRDVTPRIA
jgi:transposase